MHHYRGELWLILVTLLAASGWFVSKAALQELPAAGFIGARMIGAALLFLPFALPQLCQWTAGQFARAAAVGAAFSGNIFFWIQGVAHSTHFGEGALLLSSSMLLAPVLSWLLFRHRPSPMLWLSLALSGCGMYLLNAGKSPLQMSLGSGLFALSALMSALFFVLNNQFSKGMNALPLTTVQLACAGIVCSGYSLAFETWHFPLSAASWTWLIIGIMVITNTRFLLQTHAQKICPIGNAAMIMVLEPVWTLLFSVLILGEILSWEKAVGGALIIAALLLYRLPLHRWRKRKN